jgi:chromosome segregation ATPase
MDAEATISALRDRQTLLETEVEKLHIELMKSKKEKDALKLSVRELHAMTARMEAAQGAVEATFVGNASSGAVHRETIRSAEREKELEQQVSHNFLTPIFTINRLRPHNTA